MVGSYPTGRSGYFPDSEKFFGHTIGHHVGRRTASVGTAQNFGYRLFDPASLFPSQSFIIFTIDFTADVDNAAGIGCLVRYIDDTEAIKTIAVPGLEKLVIGAARHHCTP